MTNDEKLILSVLQNVTKNVNNKKWKCFNDQCKQTAINSHLLQVNGVLNNLVENGHLIEIKGNSYFDIEKEGFLSFKSLGINQAISEFLFCNKHDTEIFQKIEGKEINFSDYISQLLFSYRSLCCELRKKMKAIEVFTRLSKSHILNDSSSHSISQEYLDLEIQGHSLGIKDMARLKFEMEKDFLVGSKQNFTFKTFRYEPIKICVSAIFSVIHPGSDSIEKAVTQEEPLNTIFINVIPQTENLYVIVGYHNKYFDKWVLDYINTWGTTEPICLQNNLTDLLTTRVETWSISPTLFCQISNSSKQKLKDYWNANVENLLSNQKVDFNLFENI